jgi:hypothetical protein
MYIRFEVRWTNQLRQLNSDIEAWCHRYDRRHAKKVVKNHLRLTFHSDQDYSLFALTWSGQPFELVNINSY